MNAADIDQKKNFRNHLYQSSIAIVIKRRNISTAYVHNFSLYKYDKIPLEIHKNSGISLIHVFKESFF